MIVNNTTSIIYETCINESLTFFNEKFSFNPIEMIKKAFKWIRDMIKKAIDFIKNKLKRNNNDKKENKFNNKSKSTNSKKNNNDSNTDNDESSNDTETNNSSIDTDTDNDETSSDTEDKKSKLSNHDILSLIHYTRMDYYIKIFSKAMDDSFDKFKDVFYEKEEYKPKEWFTDIESMFKKIDEINNTKWEFDIDYKNDSIKFTGKNNNLVYTVTKNSIKLDLIECIKKLDNILKKNELELSNMMNEPKNNDLKIRNFKLVQSYLYIIKAVYGKTLSNIQKHYDGRNIYNNIFRN